MFDGDGIEGDERLPLDLHEVHAFIFPCDSLFLIHHNSDFLGFCNKHIHTNEA